MGVGSITEREPKQEGNEVFPQRRIPGCSPSFPGLISFDVAIGTHKFFLMWSYFLPPPPCQPKGLGGGGGGGGGGGHQGNRQCRLGARLPTHWNTVCAAYLVQLLIVVLLQGHFQESLRIRSGEVCAAKFTRYVKQFV